MRFFLAVVTTLLMCGVAPVFAQESEDKGFLTNLLQDSLSGSGRDVQIVNFQGALSSKASIDRLTIADDDGIWLTISDIVLVWERSALLSGRLVVNEFSAATVDLLRPPVPDTSLPSPEAGTFSVPQLPVSVEIGTFRVDNITLGKQVLGQSAVLSVNGSAVLTDDEVNVDLKASRIDGKDGAFVIGAHLDPATDILGINLSFQEAEGGIAATSLGIPGQPSVDLSVQGTGKMSDFTADIALATDARPRLTGTVELTSSSNGERGYRVDIKGDIQPLVQPDQQAFFEGETLLQAVALQGPDGALIFEEMRLQTSQLRLDGQLALDPSGWPVSADIMGEIADSDGDVVNLPFAGSGTHINTAMLDLQLDAAKSDQWTGQVDVLGLVTPDAAAERLNLSGQGTLAQGNGVAIGEFIALLDFAAEGLVLQDSGLAEAIGDQATGQVEIAFSEALPLKLKSFLLNAAGSRFQGSAEVAGLEDGFLLTLDTALTTPDLSRFSKLSGQDLKGAANLTIAGDITPVTGAFDLRLQGATDDLKIGQTLVDQAFSGSTALTLVAARDKEGLTLEAFSVDNTALFLTASGTLASDQSHLTYASEIKNLALFSAGSDQYAGFAKLTGEAVLGDGKQLQKATAAGVLGHSDDQLVRLSLGQESLQFEDATLDLVVDGGIGTLRLTSLLTDAQTDVGTADALALTVNATFAQTLTGALDKLVGDLRLTLNGLALNDRDLSKAVGDQLTTTTGFSYAQSAQFRLENTQFQASNFRAGGDAVVETVAPYPARFEATLRADDLAPFSGLAGQSLGGAMRATISGTAQVESGSFELTVDGHGQNLRTGIATADPLLTGETKVSAKVRQAGGVLRFDPVTVTNNALSLSASGTPKDISFDAVLHDVGLLAPDFPGQAAARGTLRETRSGVYALDVNGTGPGGVEARAGGQIGPAEQVNIAMTGNLPLGVANPFISPQRISGLARFDLAINGSADVNNLRGTVQASNARLSAPGLGLSLSGVGIDVSLTGGVAQLAVSADVVQGGRIRLGGPVRMSAPFVTDLEAVLDNVTLRKAALFDAQIDGALQVDGGLASGAAITGVLTLRQAEIQVPSTGMTALGDIPAISHVGLPGKAVQTRQRAGLTADSSTSSASSGPGYPLDILLKAPGRIFVRGRGLDAELGGGLRIGGASNNVLPSGQFELVRGRLDILTQRFDLTEGSAQLVGSFDPILRLVATTEKSSTQISIVVEGPASTPEVSFLSSPELPQEEVLALLIFGQPLAGISAFQAVRLASAVATLAGRGGTGVLEKLRRNVGLDDFDVTTDDSGNTAVKAGKYLSENVYSDVTIASDGKARVDLNLDLSPNVTVRAGQGSGGNSSLGVFFEKDY